MLRKCREVRAHFEICFESKEIKSNSKLNWFRCLHQLLPNLSPDHSYIHQVDFLLQIEDYPCLPGVLKDVRNARLKLSHPFYKSGPT